MLQPTTPTQKEKRLSIRATETEDEAARAFYLKFGMEESPTNPLHLLFLFKDIRQSLGAAE